jgi:hypothetical protein
MRLCSAFAKGKPTLRIEESGSIGAFASMRGQVYEYFPNLLIERKLARIGRTPERSGGTVVLSYERSCNAISH